MWNAEGYFQKLGMELRFQKQLGKLRDHCLAKKMDVPEKRLQHRNIFNMADRRNPVWSTGACSLIIGQLLAKVLVFLRRWPTVS